MQFCSIKSIVKRKYDCLIIFITIIIKVEQIKSDRLLQIYLLINDSQSYSFLAKVLINVHDFTEIFLPAGAAVFCHGVHYWWGFDVSDSKIKEV